MCASSNALAGVLLSGAAAIAAAPAADAQVVAGEREQLNEVIVIARQRAEPLQEIPDSITAISGETIADAGIQNSADLTRFVPNFDFKSAFSSGAATITVRGLTTPQGGDLPIAVVVDGVQLPGADFFAQDLLDVSEVEVLRGPQSALYGQGALAGAMLITTRQPTNEFQGTFRAAYGNANSYHAYAGYSGPIIPDKLLFKVNLLHRGSDGTIKDVADRGRNFLSDDVLHVELKYLGGDFRATLAGEYLRARDGAVVVDVMSKGADGQYLPNDFHGAGIESNLLGLEQRQRWGASLRLEQDIAGGVLASTSSYNKLDTTTTGDGDFGPLNILSQYNLYNVELVTEDVRFTSASDQPVRYIVGGFYQHRTIVEGLSVPFLPESGMTGFAASGADTRHDDSYAGFAQVNADITSRLQLTGALRYDYDERSYHNTNTGQKLSHDFHQFEPKASISYEFSKSLLGYFTYAQGFRSGGFNPASALVSQTVLGEKSQNYEVGLKATLPNGIGVFNTSVYQIDLSHGQYYYTTVTPISQNTINVNKVRIRGGEAELNLRPWQGLTLSASGGVSDAKIVDFNGTGLDDGKAFPTVPLYNLRGSVFYDIRCFDRLMLTPRVDVYRRGRVYFDPSNLPGGRINPYTDIDMRLTLSGSNWGIAAYVRNLGDEIHAEQADAFFGIRALSVPRSYGVETTYNF